MRILVTGGAGFIGSHFARLLLGRGFHVTVLDKLTYAGNLANLASVVDLPNLDVVRGTIGDQSLIDRLVQRTDAIVNFAAESHVDRSLLDPVSFSRTNIVGTQCLFEAARRYLAGPIVHVSTDEVYGSVEQGSATERSGLFPSSPYAMSKASSDLVALTYHQSYGVDVRVTRGSNTYGPFQYPEKIVPRFITSLLDRKPIGLYGDGLNVRDWLYVKDHCEGIFLTLMRGGGGNVYNIGGGVSLTNRALAGHLLAACDRDWTSVSYVRGREVDDKRYAMNWSKARDDLGYAPQCDFNDEIVRTVAWYRDNRAWWSPAIADELRSFGRFSVGQT